MSGKNITKQSLQDRWWRCSQCNKELHRDINAAKNIHREGATSLGLGDVSQSLDFAIAD